MLILSCTVLELFESLSHHSSGQNFGVFDERWFKILIVYYYLRRLGLFFTRESSYGFQRVLAITILSVRPSFTRVHQSKTVQARITKPSPSGAWKTLVSGTVKLFHKFEGVTRNEGAKWEGVGKICDFWPISRCISVTVQDRASVTINH